MLSDQDVGSCGWVILDAEQCRGKRAEGAVEVPGALATLELVSGNQPDGWLRRLGGAGVVA